MEGGGARLFHPLAKRGSIARYMPLIGIIGTLLLREQWTDERLIESAIPFRVVVVSTISCTKQGRFDLRARPKGVVESLDTHSPPPLLRTRRPSQ